MIWFYQNEPHWNYTILMTISSRRRVSKSACCAEIRKPLKSKTCCWVPKRGFVKLVEIFYRFTQIKSQCSVTDLKTNSEFNMIRSYQFLNQIIWSTNRRDRQPSTFFFCDLRSDIKFQNIFCCICLFHMESHSCTVKLLFCSFWMAVVFHSFFVSNSQYWSKFNPIPICH